jgi:AhpD family alkylhydroperoxidase
MNYGQSVADELRPQTRELRRMIPEVYKGFAALHGASLADGALDGKTKELIAMAIAVSTQCDGCISSHAKAAVRLGASKQEAAETLGVTLLMGGGPSSIYAPRAYAAFCEFHDAVHGDQAAAAQ